MGTVITALKAGGDRGADENRRPRGTLESKHPAFTRWRNRDPARWESFPEVSVTFACIKLKVRIGSLTVMILFQGRWFPECTLSRGRLTSVNLDGARPAQRLWLGPELTKSRAESAVTGGRGLRHSACSSVAFFPGSPRCLPLRGSSSPSSLKSASASFLPASPPSSAFTLVTFQDSDFGFQRSVAPTRVLSGPLVRVRPSSSELLNHFPAGPVSPT